MFFPEETELKMFSGTSGGCGFSSGADGMEQGGVSASGTGVRGSQGSVPAPCRGYRARDAPGAPLH